LLGRVYARSLEHESAAAVFERGRDRAIAKHDPVNEVRFASLLANAYVDSGNVGAAEEALSGAVRASEKVADPLAVARMFWSQSRAHAEQQDSSGAVRLAERALELLESSDQYYDIARIHQMLAHIELDRGNNERAAELLEDAAPTIIASGRKFELASFRIEQARALLKANRRDEARAIAMEAAAGLAGQSPVDAGRSHAVLASVFVELGDEERGIELYELAIEQLQATPNRYLVDAFSKLAELYEQRGDQEAMIETLKRGMSIQRQADRQLTEH
jgi:tetratricopeptide (TPR) repeat protein